MPIVIDQAGFSVSFIKGTTGNGKTGTPRLYDTGEATDIFPLSVVLTDTSGNAYAASSGTQTNNTVAPTNAGTSATQANPVQGVTNGVPLPSVLTAGTATIGSITNTAFGVSSLPALPAGTNAIGTVGVTALPAIPAGTNTIGNVGVTSLPSLPAGNNAIGSVVVTSAPSQTYGGKTSSVSATGTNSTSAYSPGQVVIGVLTFPNIVQTAMSGIIQSAKLSFKTVHTEQFKLYVFNANPTNSTFTDRTAPSIGAADIASLIDVIPFMAPDSGLGTHTLYAYDGIGKAFNAGTTNLYGVLITLSNPTFGSTSDIVAVTLNVLPD